MNRSRRLGFLAGPNGYQTAKNGKWSRSAKAVVRVRRDLRVAGVRPAPGRRAARRMGQAPVHGRHHPAAHRRDRQAHPVLRRGLLAAARRAVQVRRVVVPEVA